MRPGDGRRSTRGADDVPIVRGWDIYFACQLVAVVVCLLKGKVGWGLLGLPFSAVAMVGAVRLARPGSWWARRFYSESKAARSQARWPQGASAGDRPWSFVADMPPRARVGAVIFALLSMAYVAPPVDRLSADPKVKLLVDLAVGVALFFAASRIWLALWGRKARPGV
jgi:hypothetical protein